MSNDNPQQKPEWLVFSEQVEALIHQTPKLDPAFAHECQRLYQENWIDWSTAKRRLLIQAFQSYDIDLFTNVFHQYAAIMGSKNAWLICLRIMTDATEKAINELKDE